MAKKDKPAKSSKEDKGGSEEDDGYLHMEIKTGSVRIEDNLPMFKPSDKLEEVRLVGRAVPYSQHWFEFAEAGETVRFSRVAFDDPSEDPYLKHVPAEFYRTQTHYYVNVFVREKDNALEVMRHPPGVGNTLKTISQVNYVKDGKDKKAYSIQHPEHGCDVHVSMNPKAPAPQMWKVVKSSNTPLDKKERKTELHKLDGLLSPRDDAEKDAKAIAARIAKAVGDDKPKKGKGKKGGKPF